MLVIFTTLFGTAAHVVLQGLFFWYEATMVQSHEERSQCGGDRLENSV